MLQNSNKEIADFYIKLYNISLKNWKDPRIRLSPEQDTISKFSHNGNDTIHIKRLIKLIDKKLQNKNKSKINIESKLESFIRKIVKEEHQRMNEEKIDPTVDAYWKYLSRLPKDRLMSIAKSKQRISSIDKTTPKSDLINHIITSEHGRDWTKPLRVVPNYLKPFIKTKKIEESSSQAEIRDLAIDLIDYLGGQLPTQGYTRNQRIMDYFRELGYKDNDPMIHKIYNLALKLK